jgi:hypothetical protein
MKLRITPIMVAVLIALGVAYIFLRPQPEPPPAEEPMLFIWSFDMEELHRISVSLPRQGKSMAWIRQEDRYFYFDEPGGPRVDSARWGGGIPLLLSGPAATRTIAEQATEQQLAFFGLDEPRMHINLTLDNGDNIRIEVGDRTPNAQGDYIRRAESTDVYTVDYTWHDVFERLVVDPPYPQAEEE